MNVNLGENRSREPLRSRRCLAKGGGPEQSQDAEAGDGDPGIQAPEDQEKGVPQGAHEAGKGFHGTYPFPTGTLQFAADMLTASARGSNNPRGGDGGDHQDHRHRPKGSGH